MLIARKAETIEFGNCVDLGTRGKRERQRWGGVEGCMARILWKGILSHVRSVLGSGIRKVDLKGVMEVGVYRTLVILAGF